MASVYDFSAKTITGQDTPIADFKGRVKVQLIPR